MDEKNNCYFACFYNREVECNDKRNCHKCGWNEKNEELRKSRICQVMRCAK